MNIFLVDKGGRLYGRSRMPDRAKRYTKGEIIMKMWKPGVVVFLCVLLLIASAWAAEGVSGVWQGTDEKTGAILRLTLAEDGTFEAFRTDGEAVYFGTYTAQDGMCALNVMESGPFVDFKYMQSEGALILLTKKGEVFTFTRQEGLLLDESLLGTWGGLDNGMYGEITFTPSGEAQVFVPYQNAGALTTAYSTAGDKLLLRDDMGKASLVAYQVAEDTLTLTYKDGKVITMAKKPGPLERLALQEETVLAAADQALCGTWGIYQDGVYREITFLGDGSYVSFIPQDGDVKAQGKYIAWNGTVVILVGGGLHVDAYQVKGDELWYAPMTKVQQVFGRKSGPLNRKAE